jgi:hypothetical protein
MMEFLERFDEQIIHRQPDGAAPVGIAAKQAALGFRRPVADFVDFAAAIEPVGFSLVNFGKSARMPWSLKNSVSSSARRSRHFMR